MGKEYIVITQYIVGDGPYHNAYRWDFEYFGTREEAVTHGFKTLKTDDFNIGTMDGESLIALGWLEEDYPEENLAQIQGDIGLN